jgi:hypothetical protein
VVSILSAYLQGFTVAPHQEVVAEVVEIRSRFTACRTIADIARTASHVERLEDERLQSPAPTIGQRVFIGHGQSTAWRELKDFVSDRLDLPWDEFNRVPAAGVTNVASSGVTGAASSIRNVDDDRCAIALVMRRSRSTATVLSRSEGTRA